MHFNTRIFVMSVIVIGLSACGGGGSPTPAPTPTPTPTPTNRAPVINSMSFTPAFGIQQLTTFSYNASASDPDGDAITYTWDLAGNAASGTNGTMSFVNGGNGTAKLTITDSKGATSSDTRTFVVGSGTGTWIGTFGAWHFTSHLTQNSTILTGDYSDELGAGRLDPAVANTIDANGNVRLRYKQAVFSDWIFTGTMDSTGRRITGVVNGSGYSNVPFTMTK